MGNSGKSNSSPWYIYQALVVSLDRVWCLGGTLNPQQYILRWEDFSLWSSLWSRQRVWGVTPCFLSSVWKIFTRLPAPCRSGWETAWEK